MSTMKGLAAHLGVLVLAVLFAVMTWTKDDESAGAKKAEVEVWSGKPNQVELIEYKSPTRDVRLSARKDKAGRYYVGSMKKIIEKRTPPRPKTKDAGAEPAPEPEKEIKQINFIAVTTMEKLAEKLAPLRAFRDVGEVGQDRAEEFGFDEDHGTLKVTVGGKQHTLVFGGTTPGGSDRYARFEGNKRVYAVPGALQRDLEGADTRLTERKLHEFEDEEVTRVKLIAGELSRDLVPVKVRDTNKSKKNSWADAASPDQEDETASNWMTKLGRLRPTSYAEAQDAVKTAELVVKLAYFKKQQQIGLVELYKQPGAGEGAKAEYWVRSEHTRFPAKVVRSSAEQVDQDLNAVLNPN